MVNHSYLCVEVK